MREYFLGYKKYWWVAVLVILAVVAPSVLTTTLGVAWAVTRTTVGAGSEVVSGVYHAGHGVVTGRTEPGVVSHGRESVAEVMVIFDVNRNYHGWGQLARSYHQLPEITGRVYAAHIVNGQIESVLPNDVSLIAQRRRNWLPKTTARMKWTDVRVAVGEQSTHLCMELWEVSEGHNVLGTADDALHLLHWNDSHLTSGDAPVARSECVELDANHFPYDLPATPMRRPGEARPTGSLSIIWEGPNG